MHRPALGLITTPSVRKRFNAVLEQHGLSPLDIPDWQHNDSTETHDPSSRAASHDDRTFSRHSD